MGDLPARRHFEDPAMDFEEFQVCAILLTEIIQNLANH